MKEMLKVFQFIKVLIEEPARLVKSLLSICKLAASIIFSEWLYRYYFGSYQLIDLLSVKEWIGFVVNGRVFLCMLLFVGTHLLLFSFLPILTLIPFMLIAKRIPFPKQLSPTDGRMIGKFINNAGLLNIDFTTGRVTATPLTERLAENASSYILKKEKRQMKRFQHSLISELGHTIFVFLFLYFFVLHNLPKGSGFVTLTLVVIIIICCTYLAISVAYQSMSLIAPDVLILSQTALYDQMIVETCKDVNVFLHPLEDKKIYGAYGTYFAPTQYAIKCLHDKRLGKIEYIQDMMEKAKEMNRKLIIFTTIDFNDKATTIVNGSPEGTQLHHFTNRKELRKKLKAVIKAEFQ